MRVPLLILCIASILVHRANGWQAYELSTQAASSTDYSDVSVTHHDVTINGELIPYTATAGAVKLLDYEGKPREDVFYISHIRDAEVESSLDAKSGGGETARPVTFAYNGGPGSSSVWLHLGALGPQRAVMGPGGFAPKPPYELRDNEYSWLALTDLVFIDPGGTGYSRPTAGEGKSQFHGLEEDISSVRDFIRLWTTRNKRWLSPKFLAGESYGTTRTENFEAGHMMYIHEEQLVKLSKAVERFITRSCQPHPRRNPECSHGEYWEGSAMGTD